ncbi:Na+/H+ antiporter [Leptospira biflexa serovar Patoc strain 'Patoc 1 (Ames)']|uniref:Na(+)/H(+) antiporter NhaA n=1 Tax=Leptospira biflexa serovar Patoc (strain Patoc 1 / ATCC 23582 / Paris) TaxID=456481 RepID=B0SK14_LEPBP|nr:Na+/H+ antiporter NhaA [Leptospira biflexa]ABZ92956.1 Na+/H+ antiporter [Leptospira biflexa serovar Patoc strain 'Patoc 1 (Ames)']ABZ96570.1 Putative sodium:proton antiporter, NhaA family; putative membrane protein [Leptospira biflexa serovar Patoc strain 'Patoc 1 (Paris)']
MEKIGKIASIKREAAIYKLTNSFRWFSEFGATGGLILFFISIIALVWANSPFQNFYEDFKNINLTFSVGSFVISKGLILWINDALMAIFFFVVGLEIKREFLVGELSDIRKATFPIFAAIGGMLVPALIYYLFNQEGDLRNGWGIPMATDIAFALGFLALLGSRVPVSLKVFLTALAIVDDIGAVVVIGLFYTETIHMIPIVCAGFIFITLIFGNSLGIRTPWFYFIFGIFLWIAFLKSGIHATVSGVLAAFTIPSKSLVDGHLFVKEGKSLLNEFEKSISNANTTKNSQILLTTKQESVVSTMETACEYILPPLFRLEHSILPWVTFVIMPIFALANAGITMQGDFFSSLYHPVTYGVIGGLFFGKPIGIFIFSFFAVKLGISKLPEHTSWSQVIGIGFFAGIGFTMSIFVASLAFANANHSLTNSKIGILLGSFISLVVGMVVLYFQKKK